VKGSFDRIVNLPRQVEIVEVSPRDGLQMLPGFVPTADKIALIEKLKQAGFRRIEAVSFVSPKAVPQMADAREVLKALGNDPNLSEMALALNERGYRNALEVGIDWLCYVISTTETMAAKNANTTVQDGLRMCRQAIAEAHTAGVKVRASIAVTWICPYEGQVPLQRVLDITEELVTAGADEIVYNDTVGRATPDDVFELCARARRQFPQVQFAGHFHDTNFTALANIYAALTAGFTVFDASAGGLGGCPFSPGASGNVATERVVWMLENMGIATGIDQDLLKLCAAQAKQIEQRAKSEPVMTLHP
jgi:hydroxymethylglutaryl-CoA lyase